MSDGGDILVVVAEAGKAFRSLARTIHGYLNEGRFAGRVQVLEPFSRLGSVTMEQVIADPGVRVRGGEEALVEELAARPPIALVAADPLAGLLLQRWAPLLGKPLTIGVVGSLWLDPLWHRARLDHLIVPDRLVAGVFHGEGVGADRLVPIGLGVCSVFGDGVRVGREDCRRRLQLPVHRPTLLLVTETIWADDVRRWLEAVQRAAQATSPITLLVDAAGDRFAADEAMETHARLGLGGTVFARSDEAGLYWGAADRVVARALDHLITRALACRTPYWAIRPADPRQRGLVQALAALGAGEAIADPAELQARLTGPDPWQTPLDGNKLATVAGAGIIGRISRAIAQMVQKRLGDELAV